MKGEYLVTLRADAEMLVIVDADSKAEALKEAREGNGEPYTDWSARDSKVRFIKAVERDSSKVRFIEAGER